MNAKRLAGVLAAFSVALAHSDGSASGFSYGLAHPIGGLDHLLAMVAVGLWAAQLGGRALWAIPLGFVGIMALGSILGVTGVVLPLVEQGIVASVLVLGLLVLAALRLPLGAGLLLVGLFAVFHGYAHGTEMPQAVSGLLYGLGFAISTALLHLAGLGLGVLLQRQQTQLVRLAGLAVLLGGVWVAL